MGDWSSIPGTGGGYKKKWRTKLFKQYKMHQKQQKFLRNRLLHITLNITFTKHPAIPLQKKKQTKKKKTTYKEV